MNMEVVEPIINFQKIKYDKFSELLHSENITKGNRFNIFINVETILDYFYKEQIIAAMNSLKSKENIILVSEFINLIAHYRHYFYSRYGARSRFFIYHLNRKVTNSKSDYMSDLLIKYDIENVKSGTMNDIMITNMKLVENICFYLPKIYFVNSNGVEPSLIPYYILTNYCKKEDYNLIISRDYYDYQLTDFKNTFMLTASGKRSKIYNKKNVLEKKIKGFEEKYPELKSRHIPYIISLCGLKNRNIERVDKFTFSKACKLLHSIHKDILNSKDDRLIQLAIEDKIEDSKLFRYNLNLSLLSRMYDNLNYVDNELITKNLIDLKDINTLRNLNAMYFVNNNIHLEELFEGI